MQTLEEKIDSIVQKEGIRRELQYLFENASDEELDKNKQHIIDLLCVDNEMWDIIKKYRKTILSIIDIDYE